MKKCIVIVVALFLISLLFFPTTNAFNRSKILITSFDDGESISASFPLLSRSIYKTSVTLPYNAQVESAELSLEGNYLNQSGKPHKPEQVSLDIGSDLDYEWRFMGIGYGEMGHQYKFINDSTELNVTFSEGEKKKISFLLPKNATVKNASFMIGAWPTPFWSGEYVINPNMMSPGEDSPYLYVWKDMLWAVWESKDPEITDGDDWDIVISHSEDGVSWSYPIEVTPPHDSLEDHDPMMVVYKDILYISWHASETESFFSPSYIYVRSYDSKEFGELKRLTPPALKYINHWPYLIVYKEMLYIFWRTTDPTLANIDNIYDMDIVYRAYDGFHWYSPKEVSPSWSDDIDWSFSPIVYKGYLYFIWDMDIEIGSGFSTDIFCRYYDGISWSEPENLITSISSPIQDAVYDEVPKAEVYHNPVTGKEELWVMWVRGDPSEHDLDIMVKRFDGTRWHRMEELTEPGSQEDNMGHSLLEYNGRLYAIWVTGTNTSVQSGSGLNVYDTYGDVVIRVFDGYKWSKAYELTHHGEADNANSPCLVEYKGLLYAAWAYPSMVDDENKEKWDIVIRHLGIREVTLSLDIGTDGKIDWGPSTIESTHHRIPISVGDIQKVLKQGKGFTDSYGNKMVRIDIEIESRYPSVVHVFNLHIEYDWKVRLTNLSDAFNKCINEWAFGSRLSRVPIDLEGRGGNLWMGDFKIVYKINYPPELVMKIPNFKFYEGDNGLIKIDLEYYFWDDWDDGKLKFEVIFSETNLISLRIDGRYLIIKNNVINGTENGTFQIRAYDSGDMYIDGNLFTIKIEPYNDPPVIDYIEDAEISLGETAVIHVRAHDPDGDILQYFAYPGKIRNATSDCANITFYSKEPGRYTVIILVKDGKGGIARGESHIIVHEKTSNEYPLICAIVILLAAAGMAAHIMECRKKMMRLRIEDELYWESIETK